MKLFLSDFNSSMLYSIDISDNIVKLVFNTNKDMIYCYNHTNINQFIVECVNIILNNESIGKYINQQRKNKQLQEI